MRNIYKYNLLNSYIVMPVGFVCLKVDYQNGTPCMWAEVDLDSLSGCFEIIKLGTGFIVPTDAFHLGTLIDGEFVWHYYARRIS